MSDEFNPGERVSVRQALPRVIHYDHRGAYGLPPIGTVTDRPDPDYPGKTCVVFDQHPPQHYCYYNQSDLLPATEDDNQITIHFA